MDINQSTYSFGNPNQIEVESEKVKTDHFIPFISTARQQHNLNIVTSAGYLWDTSQEKAIERGNLIHLIMSQIKVSSDVDFVFDTLISLGHINSSQSEILRPFIMNIVQHEKLIVYLIMSSPFITKEILLLMTVKLLDLTVLLSIRLMKLLLLTTKQVMKIKHMKVNLRITNKSLKIWV